MKDYEALMAVLLEHQIHRSTQSCSCGRQFRPGESFPQHHAEVIMAAGITKR